MFSRSEFSLNSNLWQEKPYRMSLSLIEIDNEDISVVKHVIL